MALKILFPTDFSPAADHAFVYALKLADKLGGTISTVHIYSLPDVRGVHLPHTLHEALEDMEMEEMEHYQTNIPHLRELAEEKGMGHVQCNHSLIKGETIPGVLKAIKDEQADIVVMGTKGASGVKSILIGSNAGELMEKAPIPVLAIPDEAEFDGVINNIAMCTTFASEERKALKWMLDFTAPFQAQLHAVNVDLDHLEKYRKQLDGFSEGFRDINRLKFSILEGSNFNEVITDYMKLHNIDILVMMTHRRNFFQELFNFSYAKKMIYQSDMPILAIPEDFVKSLAVV